MATLESKPPSKIRPGEYVPTADQRVFMHRVPWALYEALDRQRGDKRNPRLSYLNGTLEIMSPSSHHERISAWMARLLEIYGEEHGIELSPYGSWTIKHPEHAGAESDQCYIVGEDQDKPRPDLVLEVVWTSGGIDKLEIYRHLEVPEVWFWIDDRVSIYVLRDHQYVNVQQSHWLPELDVAHLCSFLDRKLISEAKREYRAALRAR